MEAENNNKFKQINKKNTRSNKCLRTKKIVKKGERKLIIDKPTLTSFSVGKKPSALQRVETSSRGTWMVVVMYMMMMMKVVVMVMMMVMIIMMIMIPGRDDHDDYDDGGDDDQADHDDGGGGDHDEDGDGKEDWKKSPTLSRSSVAPFSIWM